MDETVDSFLKEINQIVPPKNVWEECFDENSGFTYYWNTQTDDVTWEMPEGYNRHSDQHVKTNTKRQLYIPPPSDGKLLLGSIPRVNKDNVKIYKIDDVNKQSPVPTKYKDKSISKNVGEAKYSRKSDSEDEKIVLISSYGTDSSSEEDIKVQKNNENKHNTCGVQVSNNQTPDRNSTNTVLVENKSLSPYNSEDEIDLLSQIQTKAKMLKQLGGEIPESVKRLVNDTNDKKEVTGFSLVAGYGDDSEEESEEEEEPKKKLFPIENEESVSPLFPISKSLSAKPFCENGTNEKFDTVTEESVDVKAFQRKRRIGVSLINVQKKQHTEQTDSTDDLARPGFGFKGGTGTSKEYPGFKSAGVIFTKPEETVQTVEIETDFDKLTDEKLMKDIEEFHNTLDEKLKFLCEGHNPALPVQIMIIQMETLYTAMREKCLKPSYLKKWLNNTCGELTKLEQEAAPSGWLLQWDRAYKRYYYHNQTTGENQWQYPQPDIVSVDEAMDISTTPPPPAASEEEHPIESMNLLLPPPPPQIKEKSISPPPPPVISDYKLKETLINGEPFPPGVDDTEVQKIKDSIEPQDSKDTFTSELNSFYSDIATMASVQTTNSENQVKESNAFTDNAHTENVPEKKKKKKMKMGQGLAMKKKGVSKLVEKWKNVQKNYN